METINKNQPEEKYQDLHGRESLDKIQEIVRQAKGTCFFSTTGATGPSKGIRPMTVQQVDDQGALWIISSKDSHTNVEIANDPHVKLCFQGSSYSDYLYLIGKATIEHDQDKVHEVWQSMLTMWFAEGEKDPHISLIKVVPDEGYYWDNKHGNMVAGIKMLVGAALGKALDDSIEGAVKI